MAAIMSRAPLFISRRLGFKGKAAAVSIAVSFVAVIVALAIAGGFRKEIHSALSRLGGDLQVLPVYSTMSSQGLTRTFDPTPVIEDCQGLEAVSSACGVVYASGIIKGGEDIHGVVFKGVQTADSAGLGVKIPRQLARLLHLDAGDRIPAYFMGETVVSRSFTVEGIYESIVTSDDKLVVLCDIHTLRRVCGIPSPLVNVVEVTLCGGVREKGLDAEGAACEDLSALLSEHYGSSDVPLHCTTLRMLYPQLFDWLDLIDNNVMFILAIMIAVAGINMIVGLLILLFQSTGMIALLKCMGMEHGGIRNTFMLSSAALVGKAMLAGNALAIAFCLVEKHFRILSLNPENYFVDFVPVALNVTDLLIVDSVAFAAIMLLLLIPCRFISHCSPFSSLDR